MRRSRHSVKLIIAVSTVLLALLSSCTSPGSLAELPDWVLNPPQPDQRYEYFVVSAQGASLPEAEEAASANLLMEINRVLGIDVRVLSDAQSRGSLDEFEASVIQSVVQQGGGTVSGLRIRDRFIQEQQDQLLFYLLASYERDELEREQNRRRALVAQKQAAVSEPERAAAEAAAAGRYHDALLSNIQAAIAASESDLPDRELRIEANLQAALNLLQGLRLQLLSGPGTQLLGQPSREAVNISVMNESGAAVSRFPLVASYRENVRGSLRQQSLILYSNAAGRMEFIPPAADRTGEIRFNFYFDISPIVDQLRAAGLGDNPKLRALEDRAAEIRLSYAYMVESEAASIPMVVYFPEFDIAGNPVGSFSARDAILQELSSRNFTLIELPPDLESANPAELPALLAAYRSDPAAESGRIERLALGSARISGVDERDGFIVSVQGEIRVYDLANGRILWSASLSRNAQGLSAPRAISSAFANLGREFGQRMTNELP